MKRLIAEHEKKFHSINNSSKFFFASTGRMGGKTAMQEMFLDEPKEAWKPKVGDEVWWDGISANGGNYKAQEGVIMAKETDPLWVSRWGGNVWTVSLRDKTWAKQCSVDASHLSPLPKPKPEHYDGEPCELPVCNADKSQAKGFRFEYTGELYYPYGGDWYVYSGIILLFSAPTSVVYDDKRWLLRPIPVDPDQSRLNEIHRTIADLTKEAQELTGRIKK